MRSTLTKTTDSTSIQHKKKQLPESKLAKSWPNLILSTFEVLILVSTV